MLSGRVPARGEVVIHPNGIEFEVVDADPRRIKRLRVRTRPRSACRDAGARSPGPARSRRSWALAREACASARSSSVAPARWSSRYPAKKGRARIAAKFALMSAFQTAVHHFLPFLESL